MTRNHSTDDAAAGHWPSSSSSTVGTRSPGAEPQGRHRWSHVNLLARVGYYAPHHPRLELSCVLVPTARAVSIGSGLALAAQIAGAKDAQLLVLRSGAASERPFPRALTPPTSRPTAVVDIPYSAHGILPSWRSDAHPVATLHRETDLGLKRNLGLLIARMCGWPTMLMLDDDIHARASARVGPGDPGYRRGPVARLDDVLADFWLYPQLQAAGYFQSDFDDNSVVCHARRLLGLPQDIFLSGGALAVRCGGPVPMFCAAYNEDWLFLLPLLFNGAHAFPSSAVKYVGKINQDPYDPFTILRAQSEELGDVLGEGLLALLAQPPEEFLRAACAPPYWATVVDKRQDMIAGLLCRLGKLRDCLGRDVAAAATRALQASLGVYASLPQPPADLLAAFVEAFLQDLEVWAALLEAATPRDASDVLSLEQALAVLGLENHVTWFDGDFHSGRRSTSRRAS